MWSKISLLILALGMLLQACVPVDIIPEAAYTCSLSIPDTSEFSQTGQELETAMDLLASNSYGGQAAVRTPDGQLWTGAKGIADIAGEIRLTPCHKTMVGSISKPITAILVMQLHEEGLLNIDDPLNQYLDQSLIGRLDNANEVNVRQLLDHTSGIRDYLSTKQFIRARNRDSLRETQAEKLAYAYGKPAYHTPGTQHTYSNTNYVLLGLLVEELRGIPLWEAVDDYIAKPLGLSNFQMGTHSDPIPLGTARPYALEQGNYRDITPFAIADAATGDGGISSNMQDLVLVFEALFDGRLVNSETLALMTDSRVDVPLDQQDFPQWESETYGLGLLRMNTPIGVAYGHTGSTSTYNAFMFYFPNSGTSFAVGYHTEADQAQWQARREFREEVFRIIGD